MKSDFNCVFNHHEHNMLNVWIWSTKLYLHCLFVLVCVCVYCIFVNFLELKHTGYQTQRLVQVLSINEYTLSESPQIQQILYFYVEGILVFLEDIMFQHVWLIK